MRSTRSAPLGAEARLGEQRLGAAAVMLFAGLMLFASPVPSFAPGRVVREAPAPLIGLWTTEDPRYSGRALRVTRERIVIERSPNAVPDGGPLRVVYARRESPYEVFELEYMTPGGRESIEILVEGAGKMRLRNPADVVWTRSERGSARAR